MIASTSLELSTLDCSSDRWIGRHKSQSLFFYIWNQEIAFHHGTIESIVFIAIPGREIARCDIIEHGRSVEDELWMYRRDWHPYRKGFEWSSQLRINKSYSSVTRQVWAARTALAAVYISYKHRHACHWTLIFPSGQHGGFQMIRRKVDRSLPIRLAVACTLSTSYPIDLSRSKSRRTAGSRVGHLNERTLGTSKTLGWQGTNYHA